MYVQVGPIYAGAGTVAVADEPEKQPRIGDIDVSYVRVGNPALRVHFRSLIGLCSNRLTKLSMTPTTPPPPNPPPDTTLRGNLCPSKPQENPRRAWESSNSI